MPAFDYALVRVVPRPERGEFVNAGVIVHCPEKRFLSARVHFDDGRILALWPGSDVAQLRDNVEVIPRICSGAADAGPIAALGMRERFHWLVAPRSSAIQMSPVHCGICESPETALQDLYGKLVAGTESGR